MLSIAVYSDNLESVTELKIIIQDFLITTKTMAKISYFTEMQELLETTNRYDIYFIDMDINIDIAILSQKRKEIDEDSRFIYMSKNPNNAYAAVKVHADYFISKPYNADEIIKILLLIKKKIRVETVIIKIPTGERRIRINHLNYINIVRRCLCYHLKDGTIFNGQTLRSSFEKAIYPLNENPAFVFLSPSLLINLSEIKIINKNHIIFENDDKLFFPMKHYNYLRDRWVNCSFLFDDK